MSVFANYRWKNFSKVVTPFRKKTCSIGGGQREWIFEEQPFRPSFLRAPNVCAFFHESLVNFFHIPRYNERRVVGPSFENQRFTRIFPIYRQSSLTLATVLAATVYDRSPVHLRNSRKRRNKDSHFSGISITRGLLLHFFLTWSSVNSNRHSLLLACLCK